MSEQLHELLAFVLEKEIGLPASKSRFFASHFAELEEFFNLEARHSETASAAYRAKERSDLLPMRLNAF